MKKVDYNEISKIYDQVREADVELLRDLIEMGDLSEKSVILDIGCGTGNYANVLQRMTGARVFGVDASSGMAEKVHAKNDQIEVRIADINKESTPFSDEFFDLIYMTDVIHHLTDLNYMFTEIGRLLKKDGKVCIGTQSHRQIDLRYISEFFPATAVVDKERYPNIDQIVKVGSQHGLSHVESKIVCEGDQVELGANFLELIVKKGYSMLHLISENEYQVGYKRLKEEYEKQGVLQRKSAGGTLVWFSKTDAKIK